MLLFLGFSFNSSLSVCSVSDRFFSGLTIVRDPVSDPVLIQSRPVESVLKYQNIHLPKGVGQTFCESPLFLDRFSNNERICALEAVGAGVGHLPVWPG